MPSSERIYHTLRQEILTLALKPGQQLREDDLARLRRLPIAGPGGGLPPVGRAAAAGRAP